MMLERITEAGALELALAIAQYFYYEKDAPMMPDDVYDQLELRYAEYRKKHIFSVIDISADVGNSNNLKRWMQEYFRLSC